MCGFGWLVPALSWKLIGYVWIYIIVWMLFQDFFKLGLYALLENRAEHKRLFLHAANKPRR